MPRTESDYVALSALCVGVGPGGTTSMLAYVFSLMWLNFHQAHVFVISATDASQ
jgi:RNA exonuclease 4